MPNEFGSIDDLLKQQQSDDATQSQSDDDGALVQAPALHVANEEVEEKFSKKMDEIQDKELETQAARFAGQIGYPHIDLTKFPITHEALKQISREQAEDLDAICFFASDREIRIGALDPTDEEIQTLVTDFQNRRSLHVELYVISEVSLDRVMQLYNTMPNIKPITKDVEIKADDLQKVQADVRDFKSVQDLLTRASTSDTVTVILGAALKVQASDVHIESEDQKIIVRFRLDGVLHDVAELTQEMYHRVLSRVKLVSSLKINITNKPQDGRFTIKLSDGDVDVRVSTIPTVFGESIVLRLLAQNQEGLTLESLGFSDRLLTILKQEIARPNGMIITTGPTGSGKSTTLYGALKVLNQPGVKIITLEDPVEYRMEGINQSQIDQSKGYTFAKGLRSILRQDPDIVMVGEIRDAETAEIAIQAALTGHLLLSTLHTNSAAGAIPRFLSMGAQPFLLAPALDAVMGQRLVRRVCDTCRKQVSFTEIDPHQKEQVEQHLSVMPEDARAEVGDNPTFFVAVGCETCSGIGYKGRIGLYEMFVVKDDIEQAILSGNVSEHAIEGLARTQGMTTMVEDGIIKAAKGITTLDEVFRIID